MPKHWRNATPIRKVSKGAFEQAGLPYFNPHSFRETPVQLGERVCQSPEEFKAWSQNLGDEGVLTTFCSYGEVQQRRQSAIFKVLQAPRVSADLQCVDELAKAVAREIENTDGIEGIDQQKSIAAILPVSRCRPSGRCAARHQALRSISMIVAPLFNSSR